LLGNVIVFVMSYFSDSKLWKMCRAGTGDAAVALTT